MDGSEKRTVKRNGKKSSNEIYGSHIEVKESHYKGRFPVNLIKEKTPKNGLHPTQKPVALMEYLIRTYTNEGETVLDFAMGSGTTGVACQNTGRNFIGIELDEDYYKAALKRIEEATRQIDIFAEAV
jgi:site-specific DNA-methyltransferase (adenine-specific)